MLLFTIKVVNHDYVQMHNIPGAHTVMEQLPGWFEDYNEYHPHKGLKMRSPREHRRVLSKLELKPSEPWVGDAVELLRKRKYFFDGMLMQKVMVRPNWEGIALIPLIF